MIKYIITTMLLIAFSTALYADDFKKRRDIINNILKEQNENNNSKNNSTITPKDNDQKKDETGNEEKKTFNPTTSDEVLFKTGIKFFHSGMFSHSLQKFRELLKDHPKSIYTDSTKIWLANILIKQYQYVEANKELSSIKQDSGEYPTALYHIAFSYQLQKNHKSAIEYYLKVAEQFPQHELADNALLEAGKILLYNNKGMQALESVNKIIKYYDDRETIDDAYYLLGQIFERDKKLKDIETARRVYKTFLKKAQDGVPHFKNSPLKDRVKKDLHNLERIFFRYE